VQSAPLFEWSEPIHHLLVFAGFFLAAGAIGFRYAVVRGRAGDDAIYADAARRAALLGLIGAAISAVMTAIELPPLAARRSMSVGQLVTSDVQTAIQVAMLLVAIVGFALARASRGPGWALAAVGVVAGTLRAAFVGQFARLVNPMHMLAAGLWIGTLFILVVAGIAAVLRHEGARDRRGPLVADMVNAFSPLALGAAAVLVTFGLITGWRHLRGDIANLWTTPYGWALIAKLCVVAIVFALGAWNWRRQRPTLGTEAAATSIRRSATSELIAAGVVLVLTAILLSIPSPRPPRPPTIPPPVAG